MTVRRAVAALVALGLTVLALLGITATAAGPASAAPYTGAASLTALSSDPCVGGKNEYTGAGFVPGETVTITAGGKVIARVKADADGGFTITFSLPTADRGRITVTATGSRTSASTVVTIVHSCSTSGNSGGAGGQSGHTSSAAGGTSGGGSGSGGLSDTGVAIASFVLVAALLLGSGTVLVFSGRRRRSAHAA